MGASQNGNTYFAIKLYGHKSLTNIANRYANIRGRLVIPASSPLVVCALHAELQPAIFRIYTAPIQAIIQEISKTRKMELDRLALFEGRNYNVI